jgi:hypothetical protein
MSIDSGSIDGFLSILPFFVERLEDISCRNGLRRCIDYLYRLPQSADKEVGETLHTHIA